MEPKAVPRQVGEESTNATKAGTLIAAAGFFSIVTLWVHRPSHKECRHDEKESLAGSFLKIAGTGASLGMRVLELISDAPSTSGIPELPPGKREIVAVSRKARLAATRKKTLRNCDRMPLKVFQPFLCAIPRLAAIFEERQDQAASGYAKQKERIYGYLLLGFLKHFAGESRAP